MKRYLFAVIITVLIISAYFVYDSLRPSLREPDTENIRIIYEGGILTDHSPLFLDENIYLPYDLIKIYIDEDIYLDAFLNVYYLKEKYNLNISDSYFKNKVFKHFRKLKSIKNKRKVLERNNLNIITDNLYQDSNCNNYDIDFYKLSDLEKEIIKTMLEYIKKNNSMEGAYKYTSKKLNLPYRKIRYLVSKIKKNNKSNDLFII